MSLLTLFQGAATANQRDDFNDNSIDAAKWPYVVNATESTGQLSIPASADNYCVSEQKYSLVGSYAKAKIVQVPNVSNGTVFGYLSVNAAVNYYLWTFWLNGSLYFRENVNGVLNDTTITYDATAHRWWQIRESGGTVYWETSPDGLNWTIRRQKVPEIPLSPVYIGVGANTFGAGPSPGSLIVDNFNMPASAAYWTVTVRHKNGGTFTTKPVLTKVNGAFVGTTFEHILD